MATVNPDKLSFNFAQAASFRYAGKTVNLEKAADTITVKDKNGQDKVIKGFQADDGTFFRLKKTADGKHQIDVYGTPEQLARSNLQVRGGEVTRARFGDERFRKVDPDLFSHRDFEFHGSMMADRDEFAKLHGLKRRVQAGLDAGGPQPPAPSLSAGAPAQPHEQHSDKDPVGEATVDQPSAPPTSEAQASPPTEVDSPPATTAAQTPEASSTLPELVWDDTPIDLGNREALKHHDGYGNFFSSPDPVFNDRLASYFAVLTGHEQPLPDTPALELLDDGQLTLGDVKSAVDQLSVSMGTTARQSPASVLADLGRQPVATLADGHCLYAALAHTLDGADPMDREAALDQRRALRDVFRLAQGQPDQVARIAGRNDAKSIEQVNQVLSAGLDGERVTADGWGGEESLKLAAMKHQRTLVTVSDEDIRIFDPNGGMTRFEPSQLEDFRSQYDQLSSPAVFMLKGFHWQATQAID